MRPMLSPRRPSPTCIMHTVGATAGTLIQAKKAAATRRPTTQTSLPSIRVAATPALHSSQTSTNQGPFARGRDAKGPFQASAQRLRMKVPHARFLLLSVLFPGLCHAQSNAAVADQRPSGNHAIGDSPAQQSIAAAKRQISSNPKRAQSFNDLAVAYLRRVRETANPAYYQDAEQALAQGLGLDPEDLQLLKTQVEMKLARHEFAPAKEQATLLNRRAPDDVMT